MTHSPGIGWSPLNSASPATLFLSRECTHVKQRGGSSLSRQHRVVPGRRKDEIEHAPRVAHAQDGGEGSRHLAGRLDDLGPLEAGKFDWADGPEGGFEFLALHLSGDTRIDHDDRRCVAGSSSLPNQGRDFMQSVLPVFSACVVSATLAVVPAQTSAEDRAVPSPAAVWPAGPLELVMAFRGPADPQWTRSFIGKSIAYFDPVRRNAGEPSAAAPLGTLRIAGAKLVDQGQTLLLATDPHPRVARYELVPGPPRESGQTFIYDLSGVAATLKTTKDDDGAEPDWKGWWPDLDVDATRGLTRGSAPHERFSP